MHYVYILKCKNNSIYTGCTSNIRDRLNRHKKGQVKSTKNRLHIILKNILKLDQEERLLKDI